MMNRFEKTISRLLKNAHLLRYPHPSPCQSTGQACCGVRRRERFETVPYEGFRLPAEASAQAGKPFIWPFLSSL
jgi:hypothetical protein